MTCEMMVPVRCLGAENIPQKCLLTEAEEPPTQQDNHKVMYQQENLNTYTLDRLKSPVEEPLATDTWHQRYSWKTGTQFQCRKQGTLHKNGRMNFGTPYTQPLLTLTTHYMCKPFTHTHHTMCVHARHRNTAYLRKYCKTSFLVSKLAPTLRDKNKG